MEDDHPAGLTPKQMLREYREMAALGGNFLGLSLLNHAGQIGKIIRRHRARTLLDYGSGAGAAYHPPHDVHREWGLNRRNIRLYDPSFKKLAVPIVGPFDGVICSDVLEHIPEINLDATIATLFANARQFVWASVCCRPAKKTFSDGTNMHVTVQPLKWWNEKFAAACDGKTFYLVETP